MSEPLKDWEKLQSQWQSYEPDIQSIKKKINWVTWRMYLILTMDVLVVLTYFPFLYYVALKSDSSWVANSWHYFMGVVLLYGVYLDFKIRLPILKNNAKTTKEVLELFINRVKAGINLAWWGKVFCFGLIGFFWLWIAANFLIENGDPKIGNFTFLTFGTIWIGGFSLVFIWYEKKKRKELKKLTILWKDYLE